MIYYDKIILMLRNRIGISDCMKTLHHIDISLSYQLQVNAIKVKIQIRGGVQSNFSQT